jgi:integrase
MDKETVDKARVEAERAYVTLSNLRELTSRAEMKYVKLSRRFQDYDRQLALVDGRYKVLPPHEGKKKPKKEPELTIEQIMSIAQKLGVRLTTEEPVEVDDELLEDDQADVEG